MPIRGDCLAPTKEEKHVTLSRAIDEVGSIFNSLERLQGDILGVESEAIDKSDGPRPSLRDVLDEGPKILRANIDNCISKIDEIRGILF